MRRVAWGLAIAVGLVALLVGGTLAYLNGTAGEARIRGILVSSAEDALAGKLQVGRFELNGRTVVLSDVTLSTPEGEPVAHLARAEATVALTPLLHHEVKVESVQLEGPALTLVQDARGLNLSRAIAAKHPKPPTPSSPSAWTIDLPRVTLSDGAVSFRQPGKTPEEIALRGLSGDASAFIGSGEDAALRADVKLGGAMTAPVKGPVTLTAKVRGKGDSREVDVVLDGPGLGLTAQASTAGTESLKVNVQRLSLAPATAQAFVPTYPLVVPLSLHGTLSRSGNLADLSLTGEAGHATVDVTGQLDVAQLEAKDLEVRARGVNLRELTGQGQPTNLALSLKGHAKGTSLDTLNGALRLQVPPSRVAGQPVGPISLEAEARNGQVNVRTLRAQLPGLTLNGGGTLNTKMLDLHANVNASDLSALNRTFGGLTGKVLPKMSGSGEFALRLRGPTRHPSLSAQGTVHSFQTGTNGITALKLNAVVPDIRKPLEANAQVSAAELSIGGKRLKNLATDFHAEGRHLVADFRTQGLAEVVLHVEGLLDANGQGVQLDVVSLEWPEEKWTLEKSAHVLFAGPRLQVEPLTLRSDDQRLSIEADKRGSRIAAHVGVRGLQLDRLPAFVVDPYDLEGTLDADVRATGRLPRPDVVAKVSLRDAAAMGYSDLGLSLDARYVKDRASGTVDASGLGATLGGTFDVPVQGVLKQSRLPVDMDLQLAHVALASALCQVAKVSRKPTLCPDGTAVASGAVSAELHLHGQANLPTLALTVRGTQLTEGKLPPSDVTLTVATAATHTLDARVDLSALGGTAALDVKTPLVLGALLDHPPTSDQLQHMPVSVGIQAQSLQLMPLRRAGLLAPGTRGVLSIDGALAGTALDPTGTVKLQIAGAKLSSTPVMNVVLTGRATDRDVTAHFTATEPSRPLLDARLAFQKSVATLRNLKLLGGVPFTLEGTLGPIALENYGLYTQEEVRADQQLHGTLSAVLGFGGTLDAPHGAAKLTLEKLGVGPDALGRGDVTLSYQDAKANLTAALASVTGGTLNLTGSTTLDLSLPAVRHGLDAKKAPLAATLTAHHFDLSFLSGMTPTVRKISGPLEANATVTGTVGSPTLRGHVEWQNGAVTLTGLGEYHDIHVAADLTNDKLALTDATLKSGGGTFTLKASANRVGDRWVLDGTGNADTFPIVSDDQLLATASLRSTFRGEITSTLVNIQSLDIPEAHFELPQVARKDLQDLKRPDDVVLLRNGRPTDASKRRDPVIRADLQKVVTQTGALPPLPPEPPPARQYWITLNAPRNLWVRGQDVNAEIGLSPGFRVEYSDKALLFGEVRVMRARLDVLGRQFDVRNDSSVRFAGAALMPYVNATAVYKNQQAQVTVYLTVRGQGKDVTLKVNSDPPLSESEIYTLLATGRLELKRGGAGVMSSGQAASIIGSLAASQLKKSLASKLPLDVLSIEAGQEGLQGSKLEAGTYVTDKIYVGYTGQLGADPSKGENSNAVKLEYQISPHWSLEMEYGDARAGGADLIWSRDY